MITIKQGDLLASFDAGEFDYIMHQCNCISASEKCHGIAKSIFERYKRAASANDFTLREFKLTGNSPYGKYVISADKVINLYTQFYPGAPSEHKIFDFQEERMYKLGKALKSLDDTIKQHHLGIPLIASGLARSYSNESDLEYFKRVIQPIFEENMKQVKITVIHL